MKNTLAVNRKLLDKHTFSEPIMDFCRPRNGAIKIQKNYVIVSALSHCNAVLWLGCVSENHRWSKNDGMNLQVTCFKKITTVAKILIN